MAVCPLCGGKRISVCRCHLAESQCENGHEWHYHAMAPHTGSCKDGTCKLMIMTEEITAEMKPGLYFVIRKDLMEESG